MLTMPAVVVLIACKVAIAGPPDQNASYTGALNLQWETKNSMMVCRRHEIQMFDQAEAQGADPQPFTPQRCQMAAIGLIANWNVSHERSNWRAWRVACPVPTINTQTGEIIAWTLPDCGHRDTVICERDTAI